ncbi:MAG: hypothetical protein QF926_14485 [Alphaproteobacteria bacterium]|nr:hypothetical protein [Alphaproteobacteria bacterium]
MAEIGLARNSVTPASRLPHGAQVAVAGDHDHGHEPVRAVVAGTQHRDEFDAADRAHRVVGDDHIDRRDLDLPERGRGIGQHDQVADAEPAQDFGDQSQHMTVVVDHQYRQPVESIAHLRRRLSDIAHSGAAIISAIIMAQWSTAGSTFVSAPEASSTRSD